MSEDCLYLNVYMPLNTSPRSGKAVMVFLHGGGFESYTAGADIYNSEIFVSKGDVIVVTVNYRLGKWRTLSEYQLSNIFFYLKKIFMSSFSLYNDRRVLLNTTLILIR